MSAAPEKIDEGTIDRYAEAATYDEYIRYPGFGDRPNRCQALKPVGFCKEHGHPLLGHSSCGTRRCPKDWRDQLEGSVAASVSRLAAFRFQAEGYDKRLIHAVVSPPQDRRWSISEFWNTRSEAHEVAKDVGIKGALCVPHPYRSSDRLDFLFDEVTERGDYKKQSGKWTFARQIADGDWSEMQTLVEPAPHYHYLGICPDFDPEAVPDGWVVKNVRSFDNFHQDDIESYKDMISGAYYVGTHGAVQKGRNSVSYMGCVHPASFSPEDELTSAQWRRIQERTEIAMNAPPGQLLANAVETGPTARDCPRDGCESPIIDIERLGEFLDDPVWLSSIDETQRKQLKGIHHWDVFGGVPPPEARADKEKCLKWLYDCGDREERLNRGDPSQTGLLGF